MNFRFLKKYLPVLVSCLILLCGYGFGQVITADVTGIVTSENVLQNIPFAIVHLKTYVP